MTKELQALRGLGIVGLMTTSFAIGSVILGKLLMLFV